MQRMIEYQGRTQNLSAWARELGLTLEGLRSRLRRMSVKEALSRRTSRRPLRGMRLFWGDKT